MCFSFEEITADNLERAGRGALFSCSGKVIFRSSGNSGAIRELAADFGTPTGRDFIWKRQVALSSAGGGGFGGQVGVQLSEARSFWGPGRAKDARERAGIYFLCVPSPRGRLVLVDLLDWWYWEVQYIGSSSGEGCAEEGTLGTLVL